MSIKLLLDELAIIGFYHSDVHEIFKKVKLCDSEVQIILKWLPEIYDESLGAGDQLVRSLIVAEEPYDPRILIDLFENSHLNSSIKWGIGYVLAISKTNDISSWIKSQLLEQPSKSEISSLLRGIKSKAGIQSKEEILSLLKMIFDKYCFFEDFTRMFTKYADKAVISFLESKLDSSYSKEYFFYCENADRVSAKHGWKADYVRNAKKSYESMIKKMIAKIEKRYQD